MKRPVAFAIGTTLSIVLATVSVLAWGLDCAPGEIYLTNQAEVDALSVTGCTVVTGSLRISGSNITSLDGLSNITSVGRDLDISGNVSLTRLNGLSNLTNVGGSLVIQSNAALTDLDGLSKLTSVTGFLWIEVNDALTNIDGLVNITSVGGPGLRIAYNAALSNLAGLSNLTSVNGELDINNNDSLTNLAGLSKVTSVTGYLWIVDNDRLLNVDGLSNIAGEVGGLGIGYNVALTNIDGLANITNVRNHLFIYNNDSLTNLDGLYNITSVVGGTLQIEYNPSLTSLDSLANVTSVGETLSIRNNAVLTNLDGLTSLTSVGTYLQITDNPELDQCSKVSRLLDQWDDAEPGPGPGFGGFPDIGEEAEIGGNLNGCNSVEEILATVNPSKINPGLNDAWYYPETSGQGFFITVFPDIGYVSLAWFTYDTELPPMDATANLGDPGHRWLTALGPIEGNQVLMNIEMTSGGIFDSASDIIRTDPPGSDGTILLTFDSCNSGTVEYDIPSIDRQGIIPIQRVASDNIALCEVFNSN